MKNRFIAAVFLATLLLATQAQAARVVADVFVGAPPPPVREEIIPAPPPDQPPGLVWHKGHWRWIDEQYVWVPGHWVRPPIHRTVWVEPHWVQRPQGWVFVQGHWQ